ncbi:hypothetical protein [Halorubrum trueperi]|uniref:Phosphohydrolase n=1 Tax=Halorubrum trueperi TaxID=2004704 RepID=A0ABD5UH47_9EURY
MPITDEIERLLLDVLAVEHDLGKPIREDGYFADSIRNYLVHDDG